MTYWQSGATAFHLEGKGIDFEKPGVFLQNK